MPILKSPFHKRDGLPIHSGPGCYEIRCIVNDKPYAGSSVGVSTRLYNHRNDLRKGIHSNTYLQRAWDKYGEDNFRLNLLEICEEEQLIEREQHYLDTFQCYERDKGYNICRVAGNTLGYRHTEDARRKMSEKRKGQDVSAAVEAAAKANRGRKHPPEFGENLSRKLTGVPKSLEHCQAISDTHWLKGPNAEEIKARMIESLTGRTLTDEHRENITAGTRKAFSGERGEDIKARMSKSHTGRKHSAEHSAAIRAGHARRKEIQREMEAFLFS